MLRYFDRLERINQGSDDGLFGLGHKAHLEKANEDNKEQPALLHSHIRRKGVMLDIVAMLTRTFASFRYGLAVVLSNVALLSALLAAWCTAYVWRAAYEGRV